MRTLQVYIFITILLSTKLVLALSDQDICSSRNSPTRILNTYERVVYWLLPQDISPQEAKFIANNPLIAKDLKRLGQLADLHANLLCKPENYRQLHENELDAIRHFLFATLAVYYHQDKGFHFLSAHEIRGGKVISESESMDLKNNLVGNKFANDLRSAKPNLKPDEVVMLAITEALKLFKEKKLLHTRSFKSGPCRGLEEKTEVATQALLKRHKNNYEKLAQQ